MKINWKVRFKNPIFIFQLIGAILSPALVYAGLSFTDLTTWNTLGDLFVQAYGNPILLVAMLYAGYNAITDPTTKGHFDSTQAMNYEKPKEGGKW
ncbi:phage holin [Psychrobacillus sp. FSL K6-1267]|uniref:phage holin n=1 Tax=Psychrobacillus sp. FSL K6-1267 TaxID=2921543 RepID=UPI0030F7D40C